MSGVRSVKCGSSVKVKEVHRTNTEGGSARFFPTQEPRILAFSIPAFKVAFVESPGSLLKMQILGLHPRPTIGNSGWAPIICVVTNPPSDSDKD